MGVFLSHDLFLLHKLLHDLSEGQVAVGTDAFLREVLRNKTSSSKDFSVALVDPSVKAGGKILDWKFACAVPPPPQIYLDCPNSV